MILRKVKAMEEQETLVRTMNKSLVLVPDEGLKDNDYPIDISFSDAKRYWLVIR